MNGDYMNFIKNNKIVFLELFINIIILISFNIKILEKSIFVFYKHDPLRLTYLAIATTGLTIIYLILSFFLKDIRLKKACHYFTFSSVLFFLLLLFIQFIISTYITR